MPTFEAEKDIEREDETEDYIESKYRRFWIYFQDLANIGALDQNCCSIEGLQLIKQLSISFRK